MVLYIQIHSISEYNVKLPPLYLKYYDKYMHIVDKIVMQELLVFNVSSDVLFIQLFPECV